MRVTAKMATQPHRLKSLKIAVESLYEQVDRLDIYLNNFESPPDFLNKSKIVCYMSQDCLGDLGDLGKVYNLPGDGITLLVDDDLKYPSNYSKVMSTRAANFGVVGLHGCHMIKPVTNYFKDRHVLHFTAALSRPTRVDVLGTGTVAFDSFHTGLFENLVDQTPNMLDVHLAVAANKAGVDLVCIPREKNWLQSIYNDPDSLWNQRDREAVQQTSKIREVKEWH